MNNKMLAKLKQYAELIGGGLITLLSILLFIEKKKEDVAESKVDEQKTLAQVAQIDQKVSDNDTTLADEAAKRDKIAKDIKDAQSDNTDDVADFLNKR